MPDNPHPYPPEFGAEKQLLLLILLEAVRRRMTPLTSQTAVSPTGKRATAFNYMILPDPPDP